MPKKKKPHWPIWVTVVIVILCVAVVLIDWERYPRPGEMEKYLEAQHSDVERVL